MLKKITKWETDDGKVFDTQEEAEEYMFEQEKGAPVQLPEPAAWRDPTNLQPSQGCTYMRAIHEKWPHIYREPLYTEQQVRDLLNATGWTVGP